MNDLLDFLMNPPRQIRNTAAEMRNWGRYNLVKASRAVVTALLIGFAGLVLGVAFNSDFLLNSTSIAAMVVYLWGYARLALVVEASVLGNAALTEISAAVTADKVVFPELLDQAKAASLLRYSLAGLLALSGITAYAGIFPVHNNLTTFMAAVVLVIFCIAMTIVFDLQDMFGIKRKLVIFAFCMFLVKTASLCIPITWVQEMKDTVNVTADATIQQRQDNRTLDQTELQASHSAIPSLQAKIEVWLRSVIKSSVSPVC